MSNKFPVYSHTDSNNSGLNVSISRYYRRFSSRIIDYSLRFYTPSLRSAMATPSMPGDSSGQTVFTGDLETLSATEIGDHAPSSPSSGTEVSGATIEVITVEKYKRSDGFANPYHIQGLNASTPDDVDDDDDEEEEEDGETRIDDTESTKKEKDEKADVNTHEGDDGDEITLTKEIDENDVNVSIIPTKDFKIKHPSIPTSSESTVSSESPCLSNTSSTVPAPPHSVTVPRSDSVSSGGQPQRLFQFTVERVPSTDSNCDQLPTADHPQTAHITPPVSSVSRAPTSESLFIPEVPSDSVSVDESITAESATLPTADVLPPTGTWIPADYHPTGAGADLSYQVPQWEPCEIAAAAAATAAVASAVVNPGVAAHANQAVVMGQTSQPHFSIAVAAASAAVAAMNNIMIDAPNIQPSNVPQPDISAFPKPTMIGSDMQGTSAYTSLGQTVDGVVNPVYASSMPTNAVSTFDRESTPSPGAPAQSERPHPDGAENPQEKRENDEGEIRFRRARYLEKRERWHDKRFLVVDTFRREEPVSRPEAKLPDFNYPVNCRRCREGVQATQIKHRHCPCSNQDTATLQQWMDNHRYTNHNNDNHGFSASKNKFKVENHFGYPETIAVMERASQIVYRTSLAASMHPHTPTDMHSNAQAAVIAAAAAASMSKPVSREPSVSCPVQPASNTIPNVTLRRKGLQRNNSHFQIPRSSPSSFSANEIHVDKVAAMAVAAVVSVKAAMERGERGLHSERSSETEVDHPMNPPTSPANGHNRDSLNRSSSLSEIASHNKTMTLPSVDRTFSVNYSAAAEQSSSGIEDQPVSALATSMSGAVTASAVNQSNAHMAGAPPSSIPPVDQLTTSASSLTIENGNRKKHMESVTVLPSGEGRDDNIQPVAIGPQEAGNQALPQSAIHSTISQTSQRHPSNEDPQVQSMHHHPSNPVVQQSISTPQHAPESSPSQSASQHEPVTLPQNQSQQSHPPQPQLPANQNLPSGASCGHMVSTGSMGATEPYPVSQSSATGTVNPTEPNVGASYSTRGLVMQGYGVSTLVGGEHGVIPHSASVNSNTSMNYLDQYHRMQHLIPVGPTAPASATQETVRQNTEARIAQSLDNVRLAMVSYFRELEEKHTYQIKSLQEEVRQLREQRERDHAIIREYVPTECLLQLGHPYASLASVAPQPTRPGAQSTSINAASMPSSGQPVPPLSQAVGDSIASTPASQSHLASVNSTQSSQPPSQQPE